MLNHLLIQEGATHPLTRADLPPTRERGTHTTPPRHVPRYTTLPPPSHPPEYRQPPDVWKGPILIPRSEFICPPRAHVWVNVCVCVPWLAECARVRAERISKRTANLWPRGARFLSSRLSSGLPSRRRAPPSDFPAGIPFRSSGAEVALLASPRHSHRSCCGSLRLIGRCTMHPPFANRDPAVKVRRLLDYLIVVKKMCDTDEASVD